MDDLEKSKLCAEAMGYRISSVKAYTPAHDALHVSWEDEFGGNHMAFWCPLRIDEQAMALVKRFDICINVVPETEHIKKRYHTYTTSTYQFDAMSDDLNRAIVECCARMQLAKVTGVDDE